MYVGRTETVTQIDGNRLDTSKVIRKQGFWLLN